MAWRDADIFEIRLAERARHAGWTPEHMKIKLDAVSVAQRLANGESAASIKSRLRERDENAR